MGDQASYFHQRTNYKCKISAQKGQIWISLSDLNCWNYTETNIIIKVTNPLQTSLMLDNLHTSWSSTVSLRNFTCLFIVHSQTSTTKTVTKITLYLGLPNLYHCVIIISQAPWYYRFFRDSVHNILFLLRVSAEVLTSTLSINSLYNLRLVTTNISKFHLGYST